MTPFHPASPTAPSPVRLARQIALGAFITGALANPLLKHEAWGIGLFFWLLTLAAVTAFLAKAAQRTLSKESILWMLGAIAFGGALAWRDSEVLLVFDFIAMLAALTLFALSVNSIPVHGLIGSTLRDLVRSAIGTGFSVATGAATLLSRDIEPQSLLAKSGKDKGRQLARALLIAIPILIVFAILLRSADPLFSAFVKLPDYQWDILIANIFIIGFFSWVVAGWLRRVFIVQTSNTTTKQVFTFAIGTIDLAVVLGALVLLFSVFVAVQIGWLFGGESLVIRTTGLSYAEYARRGFFELSIVAVLLLPILLSAFVLTPSTDPRAIRLFRFLSAILVLELAAIIASAVMRMRLYIHYYGLSSSRLYATTFMAYLAVVYVAFVLTLLRLRPKMFSTAFTTSAFVILGILNVINPDALVARTNLARVSTSAGVAGADPRYLATLGGDAVPYLVASLTDTQISDNIAPAEERCAAAHTILSRWTGPTHSKQTESWTSWNAARNSASKIVATHEAKLRQLACSPARAPDPNPTPNPDLGLGPNPSSNPSPAGI